MTLRTPRRRISPRTRLRYRAIREFFRRALGSTSQQNIKINSSIAVNVTELKRKIVGLEQQLDEVNKHCRDIASLDRSRRESETGFQTDPKQDISLGTINKQHEPSCDHNLEPVETQTIYISSGCQRKISQNSDFTPTLKHDDTKDIETVMSDGYVSKVTDKKNRLHKIANTSSKLHKHKTRSVYDNTAVVYSTSSFHSLADARMVNPNTIYRKHANENRKQYNHENKNDIMPHNHKTHKYYGNVKNYMGDHVKGYRDDKVRERTRKPKRIVRELDPEFIADIVRRQYKPVKLFNRKDSELSQFSAPVCRDQEFSVTASLKADSELCSCLHGGYSCHKRLRPRRQDLNAMKSVCDARLYSSKKYLRPKHRKVHDAHSNSDMYDLIPVKERSSPKTRKKFVEDNRIPYEYYKEVPPSPRTHRPRLNLKAQYYTELEDYMVHAKHQLKRPSPKLPKRYQDCSEQFESDNPSDFMSVIAEKRAALAQKHLKVPGEQRQTHNRPYPDAPISAQYPQQVNEQTSTTVGSSLNKTQGTDITADKTDKALTEIKDILQNFLHEIKKEAVTSQCDNSDITSKIPDDNNMNNIFQDMNPPNHAPSNMLPNSASFNNYNNSGLGMTPLIAPFTNPCCYQVLPMCSLNCPMSVPNGYVVPSQSYTCTNCVKTQKDGSNVHCCNKSTDHPCKQETEELIKEIYKFVTHGPPRNNANDTNNENQPEHQKTEAVVLTSRSTGGSNKFLKQDANVGTQPLKCQSKSCEAIGSRLNSDVYISESNESYSDSLLDKLSIAVPPQSYSETEVGSTPDTSKVKVNRFSRVLRSFGLFKKKKKNVIEEVSESESTIRVDPRGNQLPFRQYVTNRASYEHDYVQPPLEPLYPAPRDYLRSQEYPFEYNARWHEYQRRPHEYLPDYHPPYNPSMRDTSSHFHDLYAHRYSPQMVNEHHNDYSHSPKQRPTAPPLNSAYDSSYNDMQAGLCLKEVEVKSTGTQSERKMSLLKKIKTKIKPSAKIPEDNKRRNQKIAFSPQVKQVPIQTKEKPNKSLFNWRNLQAKAMNGIQNDVSFSIKTQQELTESDQKLRKALLRKLFNKKNPFSPRNTIVKTLLMKDKAMEDMPTLKSLRTKMFM